MAALATILLLFSAVTSHYPTGEGPYGIAIADFDGDGDGDLVTADFRSNTLSVLWNQGRGTFGGGTTIAVGSRPLEVVAADLDGDGDPDVAVTNDNSNTVSVVLDLARRTDVPSGGSGPTALATGDLDGDGDLDLAVANNRSNTVAVLTNDGHGRFAPSGSYGAGGDGGLFSVALGDVDGDLDLDVAVVVQSSNAVAVLTNTAGLLSPPVLHPVGRAPIGVAVADLAGDGRPEVVVANLDGRSLSIVHPAGGPTGTVDLRGDEPHSVTPADLDADGDLDLAVPLHNHDMVEVLHNDGSGALTAGGLYGAGRGPTIAAAGDLNRFGHTDLAVANVVTNTVSVLLDDVCASAPPTTTNTQATATDGPDILVGTAGRDRIAGGAGADIIFGLGGDDLLSGGGGDDIICGGDGHDRVSGDAGLDACGAELAIGCERRLPPPLTSTVW
ncbi:MAG: FG-GAP-like repeat-containing protein [Acidimicrobiales bacterium]